MTNANPSPAAKEYEAAHAAHYAQRCRADSRHATGAAAGRMNSEQPLTVGSPDELDRAADAPRRESVRAFVSFDLEHDEHLYELLLEESRRAASGFEVLSCSTRLTEATLGSGLLRQQICEADQVIVICGAHTGDCPSVAAELRIAREERKPHFLLWGRRETMCTKPFGAKSAEGMYSWTPEVLQERLAYMRRTDGTAEGLRDMSRSG